MKKIADKPLPLNFYRNKQWLDKLLVTYTSEGSKVSRDILEKPLKYLTRSVENVINIYGNFPNETCMLLQQTIDSTYVQNEYFNSIYRNLKSVAEKQDNPKIVILADSLLYIRRLFKKEERFLSDNFKEEIEKMEGADTAAKFASFSEMLRKITIAHVRKIINMILGSDEVITNP